MPNPVHPQKGPWVTDLEQGMEFIGFYVAREVRLIKFRDPSRGHYLSLHLVDRTGEIEARAWENAERVAEELEKTSVVKVHGAVEIYSDRLQVRILRLRPAKEVDFAHADLVPTTARDVEVMETTVMEAVSSIIDPHLAVLVHLFFDDPVFRNEFFSVPAARLIHHAYRSGLLEHTYEVLTLCGPLLDMYPEINRDLLITGILLHDIGKIKELEFDITASYTDLGKLIGHVVLSEELIVGKLAEIPQFPEDLALQLCHMVLAHHGRHEWGSPRRPKTLEAIALHLLENLDAQVNRFNRLVREAKRAGRTWTDFDTSLGRSLYAGDEEEISLEESGLIE